LCSRTTDLTQAKTKTLAQSHHPSMQKEIKSNNFSLQIGDEVRVASTGQVAIVKFKGKTSFATG
jgi:dsDNA-specific endonuclease/ATPase MutS2